MACPAIVPTTALPAHARRAEPSGPGAVDYVTGALTRAVELRRRPGTDLDGALALFVRRARVDDEPIERMLAALGRLLVATVRPLTLDENPAEVIALLTRRAITEYYR